MYLGMHVCMLVRIYVCPYASMYMYVCSLVALYICLLYQVMSSIKCTYCYVVLCMCASRNVCSENNIQDASTINYDE